MRAPIAISPSGKSLPVNQTLGIAMVMHGVPKNPSGGALRQPMPNKWCFRLLVRS
jgi:hypothetical protein